MPFGWWGGGGRDNKGGGSSKAEDDNVDGSASAASSAASAVADPSSVAATEPKNPKSKKCDPKAANKPLKKGRGPKAVLSAAIASALDEHFVVDADKIESNLMKDARIVLRSVKLREKPAAVLPGGRTAATITGSVDEVAFSWSWGSVGEASWVKDAALTITGLKVKVRLDRVEPEPSSAEEDENDGEAAAAAAAAAALSVTESERRKSLEDARKSAEVVKEGGLKAYVRKQVEMIVDALTLRVRGFEFEVEMPPSPPSAKGDDVDGEQKEERVSVVIGGEMIELISSGRQVNLAPDSQTATLRQVCNIVGFFADVRAAKASVKADEPLTAIGEESEGAEEEENDDEGKKSAATPAAEPLVTTYPLIEPFGYSAEVVRRGGKRFGDISKGLRVSGGPASAPDDKGEVKEEGENPSDEGDDSKKNIQEKGTDDRGLAFHVGKRQIEAFVQLSSMLVAKPAADDVGAHAAPALEDEEKDNDEPPEEDAAAAVISAPDNGENDPSIFEFRLPCLSLVLTDFGSESTARVSSLAAKYVADGSVMDVKAEGFRWESCVVVPAAGEELEGGTKGGGEDSKEQGGDDQQDQEKTAASVAADAKASVASASGIRLSMYPRISLMIDSVDTLDLPGKFLLSAPVENTRIEYEGTTLTIGLDSVEGSIPSNKAEEPAAPSEKEENEKKGAKNKGKASQPPSTDAIVLAKGGNKALPDAAVAAPETTTGGGGGATISAPFPIKLALKRADIKIGDAAAAGGGGGDKKKKPAESIEVDGLELYLQPDARTSMTQVALCINRAKNSLVEANRVNFFVALPADRPDVLEDLRFMSDSIRVAAGHSSEDWVDAFRPSGGARGGQKKKDKKTKKSKTTPAPIYLCPSAQIGPLRLKVAYDTGVGVNLKETSFVVKAFAGKPDTTSRDLIHYYARACAGRVDGFLSNAEVLGLNAVDTTASTYGAWLGMATPVGAGGGVAAIAAVDMVKGAVAAGKRARNADEGDKWKATDLFRGVMQAAGEATRDGAARRGKGEGEGGNVADWAVGTTAGVGEYVGENKSRLGAAGGAGAGMVVGTILGGPLGGFIGGVVAGAVTGRTIEELDEGKEGKKLIKDERSNTT